jgi:hypothetical protein
LLLDAAAPTPPLKPQPEKKRRMAHENRGASAQLMAAKWNKSMSTEATLAKLVTADVMAEAVISEWRTSDGESYPDPRPGEIVVFEDFYWHGIHAIPFCESCVTTIGLASAISTPTLFLLYPSLSPSVSHISTSSPTSICGGTFSV